MQELCRDFCTRYIACLRGKMQSENLLRSDYPLEHNNNLSNSNSPVNNHSNNSPEQVSPPNTIVQSNRVTSLILITSSIVFHLARVDLLKEIVAPGQPSASYFGGADYLAAGDTNDFSSIQGMRDYTQMC